MRHWNARKWRGFESELMYGAMTQTLQKLIVNIKSMIVDWT